MPELPDLEIFKQYIDSTSLHQEIERAYIKNTKLLENLTGEKLVSSLGGNEFDSTLRHGKYLFIKLRKGGFLVLHFGMTGELGYFKNKNRENPYGYLYIYYKNGYRLVYISKRKLGMITLVNNVDKFIAEKELGPDADKVNKNQFIKIMNNSRGYIKTTLMNQKKIAGIGNIYSDEILFQSQIHPKKKIKELIQDDIETLYRKMKQVFRTAVKHKAIPDDFPASYLIPVRNEKQKCPKCKKEIKRIKLSGRPAYYCPHCQKL